MSESNLNAQPVRTLVKEEEMPNVNTSSTSSSPPSNLPSNNKQESDHSEASEALSSFNKTSLLDQEAHDGLLGLAQLNHQDHISDSDDDENENVSSVSALYSLLQDDDGEHVSSLPPSATVGTNTPSLVNTHLAKRAARFAAQEDSTTTHSNNSNGSTTPTPTRKRKTSRRSAMEEDEIADAGAMEGDDDEYIADAHEDDDEEMALAGVKKRSSSRRERSPSLGANASSSDAMEPHEDEIISEEDLIHCVVCRRSNLQVNFKKNYTINTNNYKTYCDTFPQQCEAIPKPRDGESLSVCSTCYNKQWRFARGQYDPYKNRVVNKREGLKKPPKLKDSPRVGGSDGGDTPTLGSATPNLEGESPAVEGKKRKVTKRRASTSTEDALNTSAIKEEANGDETPVETPKKKVKRAAKAKKAPLPVPPTETTPSASGSSTVVSSGIPAAAVAANMGASSVPISTLLPGTVTISNGASTSAIPSPSPNKRGRKSKNPPVNIGVVSGAPATSYKKDESLSPPPPPIISNTALLISYMKRINGTLEEIYTTKIVTQHCPETLEQLRDIVMERLTQKKGELFTFDRACCNSVDRFNNSIRVEVDEFFFKDVKLNNNDSLCIYVNDKQ